MKCWSRKTSRGKRSRPKICIDSAVASMVGVAKLGECEAAAGRVSLFEATAMSAG